MTKIRTPEQAKYHREYMARYLHEHPEYRDQQNKLRYLRDMKDKPKTRKRLNDWQRSRRDKLFAILGTRCQCCGESNREFLAIDHIHGGGGRHRNGGGKRYSNSTYFNSILKDPEIKTKYRILCHNCNMSMGFYGYCPHEKKTFDVMGIAC